MTYQNPNTRACEIIFLDDGEAIYRDPHDIERNRNCIVRDVSERGMAAVTWPDGSAGRVGIAYLFRRPENTEGCF